MNSNNNETHVDKFKNAADSNNKFSTEIEEMQRKMQLQLNELEQKYTQISGQIQDLQSDRVDLKNSIKTMNDNFQQVSKNVENILAKLDNVNVNRIDSNDDGFMDKKMNSSIKRIVFNPLRKLAVGTISSALSVADKTAELTYGFKEGFEDIVAEAQYQRKRKQMATADES